MGRIFNKSRYVEGQTVEEFQDSLRKKLNEQYISQKTKDTMLMILYFVLAGVSLIFVLLLGIAWYLPLIFVGLGIGKKFRIARKSKGKHFDENYDKTFEIKDDFNWEYYESGQDIKDREKKKKMEENGGIM